MAAPGNEIEHGEAAVVRDNRLAIEQERAARRRCDGSGSKRKAVGEITAVAG
jgi:hypothetical protein